MKHMYQNATHSEADDFKKCIKMKLYLRESNKFRFLFYFFEKRDISKEQ